MPALKDKTDELLDVMTKGADVHFRCIFKSGKMIDSLIGYVYYGRSFSFECDANDIGVVMTNAYKKLTNEDITEVYSAASKEPFYLNKSLNHKAIRARMSCRYEKKREVEIYHIKVMTYLIEGDDEYENRLKEIRQSLSNAGMFWATMQDREFMGEVLKGR